MALNVKKPNNTPSFDESIDATTATDTNNRVEEMDFSDPFSVGFDRPFGTPLSAQMNHEAFIEVKNKILEISKGISKEYLFYVLDMSQTTIPDLNYSCILLASSHVSDPHKVAAHILLMEATGEDIAPTRQNVPTQVGVVTYNIYNAASSAVNERLVLFAKKICASAFPNSNVYLTSATVVPKTFNVKDDSKIAALLYETCQILATEILLHSDKFSDINVARRCFNEKGQVVSRFVIRKNNGAMDPQPTDVTGNPYRSDCRVAFEKPTVNSQRVKINEKQFLQQATVASCMMDAEWIRPNQNVYYPVIPDIRERALMPRLTITDITSQVGQSPGLVMLAVYSAFEANTNQAWRDMLRPTIGKNTLDLKDIGYLNILVNAGRATNERGPYIPDVSQSASHLRDYQSAIFLDKMAVAIDYIPSRVGSSKLQFLHSAAQDNEDAKALIFRTVNQMTNRQFERYYSPEAPIFATKPISSYAGYWRDSKEKIRDIRDFDLTAVCAMNANTPNNILEWINAVYNTGFDINQRMSAMVDMLNQYTSGTFVITGRCERLVFHGQFIDAMSAAMAASCPGGAITLDNMSGQEMNSIVHHASYANMAGASSGGALPVYGNWQSPGTSAYYVPPRQY